MSSPTGPITDEDLLELGRGILCAIAATGTLGHGSPAGLVDYVPRPAGDWRAELVYDYLSSSNPGLRGLDGRRRVDEFVRTYLLDMVASAAEAEV